MKNNKIYLILQLQCLFNTPANFTFTGKFHTDNTQHLSPVYQTPHLPSQTQPTHIYNSQTGLWTYIYRHSPIYQIQSTHTPICVELNRHIYLTYTNWFMDLYTDLTTIADQHSFPGTKLIQHTYQTKRTDQC